MYAHQVPSAALDTPLTILPSGHHVSRISDFILYSVEAEFFDKVVAEFGPCSSSSFSDGRSIC
jgi:hypothetical protein